MKAIVTAFPLSNTLKLPCFGDITPDAIVHALDAAIGNHEATVAALTTTRPSDFASVWMPYERANNALDAIWSAVSHLHGVADTPELRAVHAEVIKRHVENDLKVSQNRELYEILVALKTSLEFADLPDADRVAVEHAIRDFTLSGVALEPEARDRFREISIELAALSIEFESAVLDATDAWSERLTDERELAGVSDLNREMFANAAKAEGEDGWLITLRQPSVSAILSFAENRELRARVYRAWVTRASDQGPQAGRFDNGPRIARILELRHEAAALLGFSDPVARSLSTKMASDAGEVLAFLRDLARRAKLAAERDLATLKTFAAETLRIDDFQPWDAAFVSNRLRQANFAVDEQAVRAYFPVERVMEGWQKLLGRLFGIRLVERTDVAVWHKDARYFDVIDDADEVFGGLYLDLHARSGKRGGAWMAQARPRLRDGGIVAVPVAYMVCNFAPKGGTQSLLSHNEVATLLHETGHCLHLLFTRVDRPSIAGTNGFERDAIELPSQLMEDFAWDEDVLAGMSGHYGTGAPLPPDVFERMMKARHFQASMVILRSIELALFDLLLHLGTMGSNPIEVIEAVRDEVAVLRPPKWNRFPHSFSHIFAGGYASGYYGYLWAEQLAADGFQRFVEAGLVDRATGDRFRDEVLSRGATRPAADSFRAFRGREPDPNSMLVRYGLFGVPAM